MARERSSAGNNECGILAAAGLCVNGKKCLDTRFGKLKWASEDVKRMARPVLAGGVVITAKTTKRFALAYA